MSSSLFDRISSCMALSRKDASDLGLKPLDLLRKLLVLADLIVVKSAVPRCSAEDMGPLDETFSAHLDPCSRKAD